MRIPTEICNILSAMVADTNCALAAYHYQSAGRTNVEMDNSVTPCANFYCISDWSIALANGIVRESANVGLFFICKQQQMDFDGQTNETLVTLAKDVALDFVARLAESSTLQVTSDEIRMKSVYDEYDLNTTGLFLQVEVKERSGQCLQNYASN